MVSKSRESKNANTIQGLERALILMETLKNSKIPLGVNELAKMCSQNLSTVFRTIQTLKQNGWVYQLAEEKYIPGLKFTLISEKDNFHLALKDIAYCNMKPISVMMGQALNLCVRQHEKCLILEQTGTGRMIDFVPPVGSELPIYASASGKILLSGLPEELLGLILGVVDFKQLASKTIVDPAILTEKLRLIRQRGYAMEIDESVDGTGCIAVPMRASDGEVIASLSFSGFLGVSDPDEYLAYLPRLQDTARRIVKDMYDCYGYDSTRY